MVEVVDRCTVVVLLGVGQRLLRVVGEVRHVLLIFVVGVMSFVGHRVVVLTVDSSVVEGAVVEVLGVVVGVVVTVLHLVMSVVMVGVVVHGDVLRLVQVRIQRQIVVDAQMSILVVMLVHVLHIVAVVHEFAVVRGIMVY